MVARENSGFSVDAKARIALIDRDVPSYFKTSSNCCDTVPVCPSRWSGSPSDLANPVL